MKKKRKQSSKAKTDKRKGRRSKRSVKKKPFPGISLCMIAKDEEECIASAINSVASIVDEIIIVDTGSKDNTVQIAKSLGAEVFHSEWVNDFSIPRNISLEKARCDWILVLDADELIAESDLMGLKKLTTSSGVCWEFLQRHYISDYRVSKYRPVSGEFPELEKHYPGYFESNLCRLFPNFKGVHYQGRIHELVEHSIRKLKDLTIKRTSIRIHHYGHTPETKAKKKKHKLYFPLGQQKLSDLPNDWKACFEMGVEANNSGFPEESIRAFEMAAKFNPAYPPIWTNWGYVLCSMARYSEAVKILSKGLQIDPSSEEAYCNLGVVYLRTGHLEKAAGAFRKAILLKPDYLNAYSNLVKTLAKRGRLSEAANIAKRILALQPDCSSAMVDLGCLYLACKQFPVAEQYLLVAMNRDPERSICLYHLSVLYRETMQIEKALQALQRFCELESLLPEHSRNEELLQGAQNDLSNMLSK